MDSSSDGDGSFTWTDASDDTSDPETMAKNTTNTNQSGGEDSESGQKYKKKLQVQLFSDTQDNRKRRLSTQQSDSEGSPKKKKIKTEPDSDMDLHKKKKVKHSVMNGHSNNSYDESYLDSKVKSEQYFATPTPIKANKSRSKSISNTSDTSRDTPRLNESLSQTSPEKSTKSKDNDDFNINFEDESNHLEEEVSQNKIKKKKKKSKRKSENSEEYDVKQSIIEESFSAEETVIQEGPSGRCHMSKRKTENSEEYDVKQSIIEESFSAEETVIQEGPSGRCHMSKRKTENSEEYDVKQSIIEESFSAEETVIQEGPSGRCRTPLTVKLSQDTSMPAHGYNEEGNPDENTQVLTIVVDDSISEDIRMDASQNTSSSTIPDKSTKLKSGLSEKLTFEDEPDSEKSETPVKKTKNYQKKSSVATTALKKFITGNVGLRPFDTKLQNSSVLTDQDDIWVIRCPKGIEISAFQDKTWTLDHKCKIKLNGQTYEGSVDDASGNVCILNSEHNKFFVKNMSTKGCVRLRRRIPKAHIEDSIMVNNQTNFIPLPETKCRHPLFGANYKKAIKLPSVVRERLRAAGDAAPAKTHKTKKRKYGEDRVDGPATARKAEPAPAPQRDADATHTIKKKKKKRKNSKSSIPIKHNPESVEAWDSEKAIEENLFNF